MSFVGKQILSSPRALEIQKHCEAALKGKPNVRTFNRGPIHQLPADFCVLEFPPAGERPCWIYATCGMSFDDSEPIEMFLMSPTQADDLVELFYFIVHFHVTGEKLGAGHTVNFGRPWLPGSHCDHALLTVMEESAIEWATVDGEQVHYLWLIPITKAERDYKIEFGIEALDALFVEQEVDCVDPLRESAV